MMRPDAKVEQVYLYPKAVDFRKSIDGLAALVELDIKVAVLYAIHKPHLPQGGPTVYCGICGEQFHGNRAS